MNADKRGLKTAVALVVVAFATPATAQIGRKPPRPQVVRPNGPVWQVIRKNCNSCHGIDDYAFYALDRSGWQALLEAKHKEGGAVLASPLSEADRGILLDWLVMRFGPDSKPFPRTYIPPEITTFFSAPEARRVLEMFFASGHVLDR